MTARDPVADYRLYDEEALLRGADLDVGLPLSENTLGNASLPRRGGAHRRRRLGKLAFAVFIGALVGLAVVSGARVLLKMASQLGSPNTTAAGARQIGIAGATETFRPGSTGEPIRARHNVRQAGRVSVARSGGRVDRLGTKELGARQTGKPVAAAQHLPTSAEFGFER